METNNTVAAARISALRAALKDKGIDAIVVLDPINVRYLSELSFEDGLLLITASSAHLITDFRYIEVAKRECSSDFTVVMPENRKEYISAVLSKDSVKTVGFEGNYVSYETYLVYKGNHPEVEFVSVGDMIEVIRQLKSRVEIEYMQKAQDIADLAFSHVLKTIRTDMTELEVAVEIEYAMRKAGAEAPSFPTIAVSGDASSLPHGEPRPVKLKSGFLTMDFGAKYKGYCSDMTRTLVIGKADAELKKLYNTVLSAQTAALDFLKAGVDAGEADKVARDIIDAVPEYNGAFGHSLGHSVGLLVHERPSLSKRSFGRKLRAGEIVTVEPGIYLFGKYGCRIEDMVAIKEGGIYNFTHSTKELIEIY